MATEVQFINRPIGTQAEKTAWADEYKSAVDDNGWTLLFGAGVGSNLVAVLTKTTGGGEEDPPEDPSVMSVKRVTKAKKPRRKK